MRLFEQILSNTSVESLELALSKNKALINKVKSVNESLYIDFINDICSKIQKLSENPEFQEDVVQLPTTIKSTMYKTLVGNENLEQLAVWIKKKIDREHISKINDIMPFIRERSEDLGLDLVDVANYFARKYGVTIEGYLFNQSINLYDNISESVSNTTALKTRNDLIKIARKLTDSSNIVSPNNFESYEGQENITLRLGIFDSNSKKLETIKKSISDTLKEQEWSKKSNIFIKNGMKIKIHEIKKVFKSGAYQNREIPHLGIEITGSKKIIKE